MNVSSGYRYRVPDDLLRTSTALRRVLIIGSCLISGMPGVIEGLGDCGADYIAFNNVVDLPSQPPAPIESYDFQILQIAMRTVLPDGSYFRLPYDDEQAYAKLFEDTKGRLGAALDAILRYNREAGILTFVSNFLVPQANPFGRMLPRYDLRNPVFFIEQLNRFLDEEIRAIPNCYIIDSDQIAASFGKKFIQDDAVWQTNHASALSDADFESDQTRLEPARAASEVYQLNIYDFVRSTWLELSAMYRTIRKIDAVKVVIVDLDDTLWRGVFAEDGRRSVEGWPLGLIEALLFLKRRGVILAIASKNDQSLIERSFNSIFGAGRLRLDDFAVQKINWRPKAENVREIIQQTNVLPNSVVFIDDNPVERAAVQDAFPAIRVLGRDLYSIRRVLLWAPETQVAEITKESAKRTEMVAAQIERDASRSRISRNDFLQSLNLRVASVKITNASHPEFPRAMELINKSNQFNTTGKRWTHQELVAAFRAGRIIYAFEVEDKFTEYGVVVVAVVDGVTITQFVMSCRVIGLGIEEAAIAAVNRHMIDAGAPAIRGVYKATELNHLCKDLFEKTGFHLDGGIWIKAAEPCATLPAHVTMLAGTADENGGQRSAPEQAPPFGAHSLPNLLASAATNADFVFALDAETRLDRSNHPQISEISLVVEDNPVVLRIAGGNAAATSRGLTEGYSIRVPDSFELAASGNRIRVCVVARGEASPLPARLAVAYSTNDVGNSGWQWQPVQPEWQLITMEYDVPPIKNGGGDFIGLLPDRPGTPPVEIAMVSAMLISLGTTALST